MPLTVENGFYPEGANTYVSLEDADAYLVPRNLWPETGKTEANPDVENPGGTGGETSGGDGSGDSGAETKTGVAALADNIKAGISGDEELAKSDSDEADKTSLLVAAKEAALMRAFDWLNTLNWKGRKHCWENIPEWPRIEVPIPKSDPVEYIDPYCIPRPIKQAQCELAALIYNGNDLFAPKERGGKAKAESHATTERVDVLSESKSDSWTWADNAPVDAWLPAVYPLLRDFLEEVPGEVKNGFTVHDILRG